MAIFVPDVMSYNDYYPFGMLMPTRHESSDGYRCGFNGMEKDDEVEDQGNSYTEEYWQYSSRLGRRWNIDPVFRVGLRYSTFANNPLRYRDLIGRDTLSFTGTNGMKSNFFHKDLKKENVTLPFDLSIKKNQTITIHGKLPEVIGYSFTLSANGSYTTKGNATNAGSISVSRNFAVFTKGNYKLQPFSYGVIGGKSGLDASGDSGVSFTGTFSPFIAWARNKMKDENITPDSWTKWFGEMTVGGSAYTPEGGLGFSLTGFVTPQLNNTGKEYYGFGFDISIGVGADSNISAITGGSYYSLLENKPTPTLKLLNSNFGRIKLAAKWAEFMSAGAVPATPIYNLIEPDPNAWRPKRDYKCPTFLNGYNGYKR